MAKRQSKSGSKKKKREKKYGGPGSTASESEPYAGGVMQNMVGGFRRAVGAEAPKKRRFGDHIWTILLLLALAAVLYWRFG